jgi:hypothetical protein
MTVTVQMDTTTTCPSNACDGSNKKRRVITIIDTSITDDSDSRYDGGCTDENNNNDDRCCQSQIQQPIIIPISYPNDDNATDTTTNQHNIPQWTMIELNGELLKPLSVIDNSNSINSTDDPIRSYELGSLQVINSKVSQSMYRYSLLFCYLCCTLQY